MIEEEAGKFYGPELETMCKNVIKALFMNVPDSDSDFSMDTC